MRISDWSSECAIPIYAVTHGELIQASPPTIAPQLGARAEGQLLGLCFSVKHQGNPLALRVRGLQDAKTSGLGVEVSERSRSAEAIGRQGLIGVGGASCGVWRWCEMKVGGGCRY